MKMPNFERKYSPGYRHMICIGKTKSTSGKGLFVKCPTKRKIWKDTSSVDNEKLFPALWYSTKVTGLDFLALQLDSGDMSCPQLGLN